MRTLLDECIDMGPVVSANHDPRSINFVAGLSDPGEMIACGYLPELRRQANETDEDYADRIRPLVMALPEHEREKIMGAAIRRAGLDTSTGKIAVVVVGEPAWHKLGVNVSRALTAAEAIGLASLNWPVSTRAMSYQKADGSYVEAGDTFAIVRDDTEAHLGTVGSRYEPIQNADGFGFLDDIIGEYGAKFHTAGAIFGGRKVWMQCELPEHGFEVVRGDAVQSFALFTNPHDGSGRAWCFPTTNRVVCANTFRTASRDQANGLGIRHTGNVKAKVAEARRALGLAVEDLDTFRDAAAEMVRTPIDAPAFFEGLLDAVCDVTAADVLKGSSALAATLAVSDAERKLAAVRIEREIAQRANLMEDILTRYESERCGVGGIRGTAWSAFNAVTEHADYMAPRRKIGTEQTRLSRRFESSLTGEADQVKQTAYEMLTASRA